MINKVSLKEVIGPAFYDVHKYIKKNLYTHYWLKGGRYKKSQGYFKGFCL